MICSRISGVSPATRLFLARSAISQTSFLFNQRLSEARANTVRSLLIEKGIKPEMINNTVGQGVAQSAEGCGTNASQQAAGCNVNSRRVEILVKSH